MINHPGSTQRQTWPVWRSHREISPSRVYLVPFILYGPVSFGLPYSTFQNPSGVSNVKESLSDAFSETRFPRSGRLNLPYLPIVPFNCPDTIVLSFLPFWNIYRASSSYESHYWAHNLGWSFRGRVILRLRSYVDSIRADFSYYNFAIWDY